MRLAVEISVENGQFKAEIVNSEQLTKKLGDTGKKAFGGIAESAKDVPGPVGHIASAVQELGVFLTGMTGAVLAGAAALLALGEAMLKGTELASQHERQLLRLEGQIRATGGAAGKSVEQLNEQSDQLAHVTLFSSEQIRDAQSRLLTFTSVTGKEFDRTMSVAADLASVMGTDLASAAQLLGKALEDPADALGALARAGIKLDPEQEKVIKNFAEMGQKGEALSAVLDAVQGKIGGTAQREAEGYAGSVHKLSEEWGNFLEALAQTGPIDTAINGLDRLLNAARRAMNPTGQEEFDQLFARRVELLEKMQDPGYNRINPNAPNELAQIDARMKALSDAKAQAQKKDAEREAVAEAKRQADEQIAAVKAENIKQSALAAIRAKADADRTKIEISAEGQILEARFKAGEIAATAYFERLKRLRLAAIDADIKATRAALEQAKAEDKGDVAGSLKISELNQQLATQQQQRRTIKIATEQEAQLAMTELARQGAKDRLQIEVDELRAQGKYEEAAQKEREGKYLELLRQLKKDGAENAEGIAKAWLDQQTVQDQLAKIERDVDESLKRLADKRVRIQIDLQAGRITQDEANRQLTAADNEERSQLERELALLNDPKFANSPAAIEEIRKIKAAMADLGKTSNETVNQIARGVDQGMSGAIEGILDGTKNLKQGFQDMGQSVIATLQRIISQMITLKIINGALGLFGYSYTNGVVTAIPKTTGADGGFVWDNAIRRAPGGLVTGPGGPRDDLVPARLSNGEYVVQERAVRRVGVSFLDQLNRGNVPGLTGPAHFADGGYVGSAPGAGAAARGGGTQVSINIPVDARGADGVTSAQLFAGLARAKAEMIAAVSELMRRGRL